MFYYALTIRKSTLSKTHKQADKCLDDLIYFIKRLKELRTDVDIRCHFETVHHDKGLNIHLHGMLTSPAKVSKQDIRISKGYHVHIEECRSVQAWRCYISKDGNTIEDIQSIIANRFENTISILGAGDRIPCSQGFPEQSQEHIEIQNTQSNPELLEYGLSANWHRRRLPGI